jgi:DNA-binding HxlR family transcriptional regulator
MDVTMDFIGGKWKTVILWYLKGGTRRFSELGRLIPEITEKMLSIQLKDLEDRGLVQRTAYPEIPPRVEYSLTPLGRTLVPVLNAIAAWGRRISTAEGKLAAIGRQKTGAGRRGRGNNARRTP